MIRLISFLHVSPLSRSFSHGLIAIPGRCLERLQLTRTWTPTAEPRSRVWTPPCLNQLSSRSSRSRNKHCLWRNHGPGSLHNSTRGLQCAGSCTKSSSYLCSSLWLLRATSSRCTRPDASVPFQQQLAVWSIATSCRSSIRPLTSTASIHPLPKRPSHAAAYSCCTKASILPPGSGVHSRGGMQSSHHIYSAQSTTKRRLQLDPPSDRRIFIRHYGHGHSPSGAQGSYTRPRSRHPRQLDRRRSHSSNFGSKAVPGTGRINKINSRKKRGRRAN